MFNCIKLNIYKKIRKQFSFLIKISLKPDKNMNLTFKEPRQKHFLILTVRFA